jgi:predicted heme/steroid binding protein
MRNKPLLLGMMMILVLALLAGCAAPAPTAIATPQITATIQPTASPTQQPSPSQAPSVSPGPSPAAGSEKTFTLDELAKFNGKNGQPAYVAVEGIVYDVTNNKGWKNGQHQGYSAGMDLTEFIKAAPHGLDILKDVPVVGKLVSTTSADAGLALTLEQLSSFDGTNGKPAYIAVDGVIYDVTNNAYWKNGAHNGYTAGKDLTAEIKEKSPHGLSVLEKVPVIGQIKK